MDWISLKNRAAESFGKYRYVILAVLAGIALLALPGKEQEPVQPEQAAQEKSDLEDDLARVLARIDGAGKVEVLLTIAAGEQTVYQTDRSLSDTDQNLDTVLVTDENRREGGLVVQVLPPVYRGAVVVCQGADRATVRLAVVEAVMDVTGLSSDRITVLKMK